MSIEQKLTVSHRGLALKEFRNEITKVLQWLSQRHAEEEMRRAEGKMCVKE